MIILYCRLSGDSRLYRMEKKKSICFCLEDVGLSSSQTTVYIAAGPEPAVSQHKLFLLYENCSVFSVFAAAQLPFSGDIVLSRSDILPPVCYRIGEFVLSHGTVSILVELASRSSKKIMQQSL